jgi:CRISPR-associated protein Csb2
MGEHLLLSIRLHGGDGGLFRYHGVVQGRPEWPPSPARVFQALVAAGASGGGLPTELTHALRWLERLPPPVIAAPVARVGARVTNYVPNNDADAVSDPRDVSSVRTQKTTQPLLIESDEPLLYAWPTDGDLAAGLIVEAAEALYQLGRGVDLAWAVGERVDDAELERRLAAHPGVIYRPELDVEGKALACPLPGSLESLELRYKTKRFASEGTGRGARLLFRNAPKPRFRSVTYERVIQRALFELRDGENDETRVTSWPVHRTVSLVETLRDGAAARLRDGLPECHDAIERSLIGRSTDGRRATRVHIVPLPSIGHPHADRAIRRFIVETPSGGPLRAADVDWAFSGVTPVDAQQAPASFVSVRASAGSDDMLRHYVGPARRWRTVTPAVLPEGAKRRRIDPRRQSAEAKSANERLEEETRAAAAVATALRHAGLRERVVDIRVQREPFEGKGTRAEPFAEGTRFAKERLWHVEIELDRTIDGPLVIGDGRFLGLGVMAPVKESWAQAPTPPSTRAPLEGAPERRGLFSLQITSRGELTPVALARALRRAVIARCQVEYGRGRLPSFFTGHDDSGGKVQAAHASHLAFQLDPERNRLLIITPHCLDRRTPRWEERVAIDLLERALDDFAILRAGSAGLLRLARARTDADDPLVARQRTWRSLTPYAVTRHVRASTAREAVAADVLVECARCGLPRPQVTVLDARGVPGNGLQGHVRLEFAAAIAGPLLLGRSRFLGGGLFAPDRSAR